MTDYQIAILKSVFESFKKAQSDYYFGDVKTDKLRNTFEDCWGQLEDLCEFYIGHPLSPTRIITKASDIDIETLIVKLDILRQAAIEGRLDDIIAKEGATLLTDDAEAMPSEPFDFLLTA